MQEGRRGCARDGVGGGRELQLGQKDGAALGTGRGWWLDNTGRDGQAHAAPALCAERTCAPAHGSRRGVECRNPGARHSHKRQSVHRVGASTHGRAESLSVAVCDVAPPAPTRPRGSPSLQGPPVCARWAGRVPEPSCPAVDATVGGLRLCKGWRSGTFQQTALRTRTTRRGAGRAQRAPAKGCPACAPGGGAQASVERVPPPERRGGHPAATHALTPPTAAMHEGPRGATADVHFYPLARERLARTPTCATPRPTKKQDQRRLSEGCQLCTQCIDTHARTHKKRWLCLFLVRAAKTEGEPRPRAVVKAGATVGHGQETSFSLVAHWTYTRHPLSTSRFAPETPPPVRVDHSGRPGGGLQKTGRPHSSPQSGEMSSDGATARSSCRFSTRPPVGLRAGPISKTAALPTEFANGPPPRACSSRHLQAGS